MLFKLFLIFISFEIIFSQVSINSQVQQNNEIKFYEEPIDTYLTKTIPAILKCKIENARTGFFKCNNEWSQEQTNARTVQVGNKQILTIEQDITRSQIEEHRKTSSEPYWCICQGWSYSGETVISRKAYVKLATLGQNFVWEPMNTAGSLGKSVEIRCLPPEGDPKPNVYWLKNGIAMDKSNKRVFVSHEGSLLLNDVRLSDSANYTCIVENLAGKRISDSAVLIISENKGWSDWTNWTECSSLSHIDCGEGIQKRYRTCYTPSREDNKSGCEGSPVQVVPCTVECEKANENSPTFEWSDWSDWLIECDNRDNCLKIRKRTCLNTKSSKKDSKISLNNCIGNDRETTNCSKSFCESHRQEVVDKTQLRASLLDTNSKQYLFASIIVTMCLVIIIIILVCTKSKNCRSLVKMNKYKKTSASINHHPIYYSVQPDYTQETYMDICSLLPTNNLNIGINSTTTSNTNNSNSSCNSSITTTTINGDHKQCSSPPLTASPTDSLKFLTSTLITTLNNQHQEQQQQNKFTNDFNINPKVNEYEIIKLINEHQQQQQFNFKKISNKVPCVTRNQYENSDLHMFEIFNNGGFIEIPKYSFYALIPDDVISDDLEIGLERFNDESIELTENQTLLSSIYLIKCQKQNKFSKPIIISIDNTAQSIDTDWETNIYFKSLNSNNFKQIDETKDLSFYSYMLSNRSYIMTENAGYYAVVGEPKVKSTPAIKYMKYSVLMNSQSIKILLIQNTKAALEIVNEEMSKSNAKLLQIPKLFELKNFDAFENKILFLEIIINMNKSITPIEFSSLWRLKKDFYEIEIPLFSSNNTFNSNVNLNACLKHENEFLFAYSTHEVFLSKYEQQEFYSSVSVNPVFVPLKISTLLDDYISKSFKMSTLKRNDWRLFADLLNCDRNAAYFSNKSNSFELIISLWLLINLNQNENFAVNLNLLSSLNNNNNI